MAARKPVWEEKALKESGKKEGERHVYSGAWETRVGAAW
jgi:hypothetical protein